MKHAGFDLVIIEGASDQPVLLWLSDGMAEIRNAKDFWGMTTDETESSVRKSFERRARTISIGPGGENLVKFSCVMEDGHAAGRGGMGCVMGSKKLKSIVARGDRIPELANPDELKKLTSKLIEQMTERAHR
ncbi:MAG: aldehyde:ferredoxin oxidoreductase [Thermoproteota archaeon]|nr:aldehyde:ferredoxin oxidoreductase [Thermoproteota archaeon]